jgi:hypothetical protein
MIHRSVSKRMKLCPIRRSISSALLMIALSAGAGAYTSASGSGGISGYLLDIDGKPMRDATVTYWRPSDAFWVDTSTNKQGFFSDIDLETGRYYVALFVHGTISEHVEACAVTDLLDGEQKRITLRVGECQACACADRSAHSLVDPDETADVYRIW